jgi:hypothetical protein
MIVQFDIEAGAPMTTRETASSIRALPNSPAVTNLRYKSLATEAKNDEII